MNARVVAALAGVVALAAGCGVAPARIQPDPAAADDAPTLDVGIERSRSAAGRGVLEVVLTTPDGGALEVTSLQLLDARFAPADAVPKSTTVPADGRRVVTPVPATEAVCDAGETAEPARVAAAFTTPAGTEHEVVVAVDAAGQEVLSRLHADECRRRATLAAVTLTFGPDWTTTSHATATGVLVVERGEAVGPVVVDALQGTVIFALGVPDAPASGPVLTLPAGRDRAELAVEVSASRCDPHALIESKKTYLFPTWVRVGDDDPVFLTTEPTGAARAAFEELLQAGCFGGAAGGGHG